MALQRTILHSCPTGDFQAQGDVHAGRFAMRAKNSKFIRAGWTTTTLDEFESAIFAIHAKYTTETATTVWDNSAKTLTVTLTFPDLATADADAAEFAAYTSSFVLDPTHTEWTFVSSTDANI